MKTILIKYDADTLVDYLHLSSFLTFLGYFPGGFRKDIESAASVDNSSPLLKAATTIDLGGMRVAPETEVLTIVDVLEDPYSKAPEFVERLADDYITEELLELDYSIAKFKIPNDDAAFYTYHNLYEFIREVEDEYGDLPQYWCVRATTIIRLNHTSRRLRGSNTISFSLYRNMLEDKLKSHPEWGSLRLLLAEILAEMKEPALAVAHLEALTKIKPSGICVAPLYLQLGRLREAERNLHRATKDYQLAVENDIDGYKANYLMGRILSMMGDHSQCYKIMSSIIKSLDGRKMLQPIEDSYIRKAVVAITRGDGGVWLKAKKIISSEEFDKLNSYLNGSDVDDFLKAFYKDRWEGYKETQKHLVHNFRHMFG